MITKGHGQDVPPNRRRWSDEEKIAILRETLRPDETVVGVARRHGVSAVSLYTWRKEFSPEILAGHDGRRSNHRGERNGQVADHRPVSSRSVLETPIDGNGHDTRPAAEKAVRFDHDGRPEREKQLEQRVRELEFRLERLQARYDALEMGRRSLTEVLRTLGAQLNLMANLNELPGDRVDGRKAGLASEAARS